jgi:hypothetical protein
MPKLAFWNLGGATEGTRWIGEFLRQERPDIAGFAEIRQSRRIAPDGYEELNCEARIYVLCRSGFNVEIDSDGQLRGFIVVSSGEYTLALCHLMSSINGGSRVRRNEMGDLSSRLRSRPWQKIIVLGDLNCPPFDADLVSYDGLHGKQTADEARDPQNVQGVAYPKLVALGHACLGRRVDAEGREFAGSFYFRGASHGELPWHLIDHALVSPDLVEAEMRVVAEIDGQSLLPHLGTATKHRVHPDHLPVVVEW